MLDLQEIKNIKLNVLETYCFFLHNKIENNIRRYASINRIFNYYISSSILI